MPKSIVYNEDCLPRMRQMADNAFSLAICDVPYGISRSGQKLSICKKTQHNRKYFEDKKWDSSIPQPSFFTELFRVSQNQILWGANYFPQYLTASRGWIYWDKGQEGLTMSDGELAWTSFNLPLRKIIINRSIFTRQTELTIHPTQKPIKLYKWLLKNYAKQGQTVLDTHGGSFSSRIACYDLGFDFVGFENDADYFKAAEERFQNHIKQPNLFAAEKIQPKQMVMFG